MRVVEIYESIQGEGSDVGMRAVFVRLWGCNMKCNRCDSRYTFEGPYRTMTVEQVVDEILTYDIPNVIITGGEPMLQRDEVEQLAAKLRDHLMYVSLETNGSIVPFNFSLFDRIVVSPKLQSHLEYWLSKIQKRRKIILKIVSDGYTWGLGRYRMETLLPYRRLLDNPQVYFMPEGTTVEELQQSAEGILTFIKYHHLRHVRISPRMHIVYNWR